MRSATLLGGCRIHVLITRVAALLLLVVALLSPHGSSAQEVKLNEVLRSLFYAPQCGAAMAR
jgi:hypothetical protein